MDDDEAALLAELRAISGQSAAANRFDDTAENNHDNRGIQDGDTSPLEHQEENPATTPPEGESALVQGVEPSPPPTAQSKTLPPWKRANKPPRTTSPDVDVVVAAPPNRSGPPPPTNGVANGANLSARFQPSSLPNTFQGDRGGVAEDEALLAELRAISSKSASASRFAETSEGDDTEPHQNLLGSQTPQESLPAHRNNRQSPGNREPAGNNRKGPPRPEDMVRQRSNNSVVRQKQETQPELGSNANKSGMDIMIPHCRSDEENVSVLSDPSDFIGGFSKSPMSMPKSTFHGERGGAAEDEELLAELRAISMKSASANRFADNGEAGDDNNNTAHVLVNFKRPPANPVRTEKSNAERPLPPWKEQDTNSQQSMPDADLSNAVPPIPATAPTSMCMNADSGGGFQKSSLPNTFQGERGGAAEDADLLAELRAISSQSVGAGGEDGYTEFGVPVQEEPLPKPANKPKVAPAKKEATLPPWKRGKPAPKPTFDPDLDVILAPPKQPPVEEAIAGFQKPCLPNTFQGERGGAAEDADLLAELRAISSQSAGADRFAGGDEEFSGPVQEKPMCKPTNKPKVAPNKKEAMLPSWKRGKPAPMPAFEPDADVVIAAPKQPPAEEAALGFKKPSLPNTFQGERGGAAEDADLLAELRAISSQTAGANRFVSNDEDTRFEARRSDQATRPHVTKEGGNQSAGLPPWKSAVKVQSATKENGTSVGAPAASSSPPTLEPQAFGGFQKSALQNTFKGDRGGSAEDADLLAELRAISAQSGGGNRFSGSDDGGELGNITGPQSAARPAMPPSKPPPKRPSAPSTSVQTKAGRVIVETKSPAANTSDISISMDDLPGALSDKNWKTRKQAYDLLHNSLAIMVSGKDASGNIDATSIVEQLDSLLPAMVEDSNASALDSGLQFAVSYADYCAGATSPEQARDIMVALVNGNALSATRPSTTQLSAELVLKLIEVGGVEAAHAVSGVLLSQGMTSRKPKVVIASSGLILDAAFSFGAACLPLALVTSAAPKFLAHSNAKVRENGLKIIAEIARALGSVSHIQAIVDGMKNAQAQQLNQMIEEQPLPAPIGIGFRGQAAGAAANASPGEALAALEAGKAEMEAKRFSARPAVNIFEQLLKTDYSTRINEKKWSEKVTALNKLLECAGEKPYKLVEPSSQAKYGPLITEMRNLLGHTHFAVVSKAMEVLSMLAEGGGDKLFTYLRPLVGSLLSLSKDKKLTKAVAACLDSFFGCILSVDHLLEEDALPDATNERKEKNALARASALEFLGRCVSRGATAGPRGNLSISAAERVANFCVAKLDDGDAGVRKAALEALQSLQAVEDAEVSDAVSSIIDSLQKTNARAYKTLCLSRKPGKAVCSKPEPPNAEPAQTAETNALVGQAKPQARKARDTRVGGEKSAPAPPGGKRVGNGANQGFTAAPRSTMLPSSNEVENELCLALEDALEYLAEFDIPNWNESLDNGGILAGIQSTKWMARQNAIQALAANLETGEGLGTSFSVSKTSACLMVAVKEHTRGFKETNVNVAKAIMEFFLAICDYHANDLNPLPQWAMSDIVSLAVDKIVDKKLSALSKALLTASCVVYQPQSVLMEISSKVDSVKSPIPHEECMNWLKSFINDFGAASVGNGIKNIVPWLLREIGTTNLKVKRAALSAVGSFHVQLGPIFKAVVLSQCKDSNSGRAELEKTLDDHPYDPSSASAEWPKIFVGRKSKSATSGSGGAEVSSGQDNTGMDLGVDLPRVDLFANLASDCATKMGSKDGKTAWKLRKQAIEDVETAVSNCNGLLLDITSMAPYLELMRALKERLSDSQGNLKPLSARVIGTILSLTEKASQSKLGRIVYAPLINAAILDIKKPMREASIEALKLGTNASTLEGGGLNTDALEAFVTAFVGELNETALKAGGLPEFLDFVLSFAAQLPNMDKMIVTRGQRLGEKFAHAIVDCLTSSKSETRAKAETLLTLCVKNEVISIDDVKARTERMKPALQRSVGPIIAKVAKSVPALQTEKENLPTVDDCPARTTAAKTDLDSNVRQPTRNRDRKADRVGAPPTLEHSHSSRPAAPTHPLVGVPGSAGFDKSRSLAKSMIWPEYPEEPLGHEVYNQLKKAWSPLLPPPSTSVLFPAGGIKKQDDGKAGCEVLSRALVLERSGEGSAVEEQLDLIFRWLVLVLCSKENTVGLQALLSLMNGLFVYLQEIKYELSDCEALILVPFIFDKASSAKGRFGEVFGDLTVLVKAENVLPAKRLGSVVCVAMIERSSHAKARVVACQDCGKCVQDLGLSGIGKRGVLVAAKSLSEETVTENRNAALDLMELVVARMNGDIQRLARICGANLSDKARRLIEERIQRRKTSAHHPAEESSSAPPSATRRSGIPTPTKTVTTSDNRSIFRASTETEAGPASSPNGHGQAVLYDELPALNLRNGHTSKRDTADLSSSARDSNNEDAIGFNLSLRSMHDEDSVVTERSHMTDKSSNKSAGKGPPGISTSRSQQSDDSFGAAATLRARLLKIREKSQAETTIPMSVNSGSSESNKVTIGGDYINGTTIIKGLMLKPVLDEADADLGACIEVLKKYHSSLSGGNSILLSKDDLMKLRNDIAENADELVGYLGNLTKFSFSCDTTARNAGISVSLLSVCLATLMALFRDQQLAVTVSQERLTLLIRETGTALLDPRLAVSAQTSSHVPTSIDDATATQIVRALNKLAVQAATGGARHAALGGLLTLQRELSFDPTSLNKRLSRVVSKLFNRVVKAEEGVQSPYAPNAVNMDAIYSLLDQHFRLCGLHVEMDDEAISSCHDMAKTLVTSIIKFSSGGASALLSRLGPGTSDGSGFPSLTGMVSICAAELGDHSLVDDGVSQASRIAGQSNESQQKAPPTTPSKDVAGLVSALGGAQSDEEREAALAALRRYKAVHGDKELDLHLEQVSSAFRTFIRDKLHEDDGSCQLTDASERMSDRLRTLRSRLHASESGSRASAIPIPAPTSPSKGHSDASVVSGGGRSVSSTAHSVETSSGQSLRERLAAAQENRKHAQNSVTKAEPTSSRASALRARLEAVKRQTMSGVN